MAESHEDAVGARVARLRTEAAALVASDLSSVDAARAAALHRDLRSATDQLGIAAARLLAVVEADGRWAAGGARTFPEWVARRQGTSVGAVRQEAALGRALQTDLPGTGPAVAAGRITLEHAQVLTRLAPTSPARSAALTSDLPDRNEAFLLGKAQQMGVDSYRTEVRRWAARVDAEAAERDHEAAAAKEYLTLSRRDDGVAIRGFLTTEHGAVLITALRAVVGVPSADDARTPEERNGAALAGLARLTLDKGLVGGGALVRPHLSVHVSWETMQSLTRASEPGADNAAVAAAGSATSATSATSGIGSLLEPATLETGEPLPPSVLARIACDSEISRIVFGPHSEILDVGRSHRTYSGSLRRAVIARDRTCRYPGCEAPPSLSEVHHVTGWARGGATSISNGVLLCWYHHDLVHRRGLQITRDAAGQWELRRSDGAPLGDPPHVGVPPSRAALVPSAGVSDSGTHDQPPGRVDQSVPAAARREPGRLVRVG